ncbi:MAG TPA: D-alanyl-D-alanine carboxypeptidase family protein [Thermomicrobiaceae bacterium]|nr:D-alanyl-D-alanine carboxypeptidase family protein [Thermomicrobiaceae bacterium]
MRRRLSPALPKLGMLLITIAALVAALPPGTTLAAGAPVVTAEYATVVNADTGEILYDKSMNTPTAPASLTKIFTAAVALDSAPLTQQLTVDKSDLVGEASMGLQAGQQISLETALYGMLLPSGNDAAMAIASNLGAARGDTPQQAVQNFVDRVNQTAQRLGLTGTHLLNPHGLDQNGHQTTARDIAAITMYALRNPEFRKIIGAAYYSGDGFQLYQANRLLSNYPGLIGGKTGITDNAGYCLVEVAQRDGHTIIAVVLKSTQAAWYQDATTLLDYGFGALAGPAPAEGWPKISLVPAAPAAVPAPETNSPAPSVPNLQVDRIAATTAVVRPTGLAGKSVGFSWRWPIAAVASMGVTLALMVNYPMLLGLGGLVLDRRRARRLSAVAAASRRMSAHPRGHSHAPRRAHREHVVSREADRTVTVAVPDHPRLGGEADFRVVPLNAAETIAARAVRLAQRGDYEAASNEFARALRADDGFDLTRCPGFWTMQPAGYVAAVRAYVVLERPAEARTLATVVQLSFGTSRELERVARKFAAAPAVV